MSLTLEIYEITHTYYTLRLDLCRSVQPKGGGGQVVGWMVGWLVGADVMINPFVIGGRSLLAAVIIISLYTET